MQITEPRPTSTRWGLSFNTPLVDDNAGLTLLLVLVFAPRYLRLYYDQQSPVTILVWNEQGDRELFPHTGPPQPWDLLHNSLIVIYPRQVVRFAYDMAAIRIEFERLRSPLVTLSLPVKQEWTDDEALTLVDNLWNEVVAAEQPPIELLVKQLHQRHKRR